jgi:predicted glycosyltransferase involved in capsule biosynthesis
MRGIYSASEARNYGSKIARGKYLLFFDVDLVARSDFLDRVLEDIKTLESQAKEAFSIYPCLYLSEAKTKEIEKRGFRDSDFRDIKLRYLEGFNDEVLYLAVNTSTILVQREHFFNIGGYSEVFRGHGYEDFELIHRLYLNYPIVKRGIDYIIDFKTPFPYCYRGFRKYFAYYALPNFFEDKFTLHLWHDRPLTKKYYRNRENNLVYFLEYLNSSLEFDIRDDFLDKSLGDYNKFIDTLMEKYGFESAKYCGLRELNSYSKNSKPKVSLKRKIRRKFLNLLDRI